MQQNICTSIPPRNGTNSIHLINFVLETERQEFTRLKVESVYKMYYVQSGQGYIHTLGGRSPIKKGDVFFTFPAFAFAIESERELKYMYISFVGLRGSEILDRLKISPSNFIFHNAGSVGRLWEEGVSANYSVVDWISESVLLYTFAHLGKSELPGKHRPKQAQNLELIKKYIDDNFTDQDFSLDTMSRKLSYNKKYVSHVFKKHFSVGIAEYLNTVRIQNACALMEQGFTSITDIAYSCGYADPQYFSKIFKAKIGMAPTAFVKKLQTGGRP